MGTLRPIPRSDISKAWPLAQRLLAPAIELSAGTETAESLFDALSDGRQQLFIFDNKLAVTTSISTYPSGKKVLTIQHLGGEGLIEALPCLTDLEIWGAMNDCSAVEIYGRKEWGRVLPGYKPVRVHCVKEI